METSCTASSYSNSLHQQTMLLLWRCLFSVRELVSYLTAKNGDRPPASLGSVGLLRNRSPGPCGRSAQPRPTLDRRGTRPRATQGAAFFNRSSVPSFRWKSRKTEQSHTDNVFGRVELCLSPATGARSHAAAGFGNAAPPTTTHGARAVPPAQIPVLRRKGLLPRDYQLRC